MKFNGWKIVYKIYPPILRFLESLKIHSGRQPYLLGKLKPKYNKKDFETRLKERGFENAILAWKDEGEILSMRKKDKKFQYHLRLFKDREVRGHYEYSSEGSPLKHVFRSKFEKRKYYFNKLLKDFLD